MITSSSSLAAMHTDPETISLVVSFSRAWMPWIANRLQRCPLQIEAFLFKFENLILHTLENLNFRLNCKFLSFLRVLFGSERKKSPHFHFFFRCAGARDLRHKNRLVHTPGACYIVTLPTDRSREVKQTSPSYVSHHQVLVSLAGAMRALVCVCVCVCV